MNRSTQQRVALKNGQSGWLRAARLEDGEALYAVERAIVASGEGVVRTLGGMPPAQEFVAHYRQIFQSALTGDQGITLLAVRDGGAIAGSATAKRLGPDLVDHVAVVSVGVHPEHQGLGLGRHLMEGILRWAREGEAAGAIERLELYVHADNERALALYQALGFVVEGRRRGFVKTPAGGRRDDLVMGLLL
jgi:putative acetyltransferase